jgi:phosphoglycolate phosphatase
MGGDQRAKLVLFDIDGTLLYSGGAGRRAMRQALLDIFGTVGPIQGYPFAGKTDPQIISELMTLAGTAPDVVALRMPLFWDRYVECLRDEIARADGFRIYPGVLELIRALSEKNGIVLGLQTGNIQRGARLKLEPAGLNPYFTVGAFGDDSIDRDKLPQIAVQRVREQCGRIFRGQEVVVVGDTPADISCARCFGARAVVVATGFQSRDELEKAGPDALFDDFSDAGQVVQVILEL